MQKIGSGIILTLLLLLFVTEAWGALPQTINYQGYLKKTDGTPVNTAVNVTFSLYVTPSGVGAIWTETRSVTPANGVYSVQLGSVNALTSYLFTKDILYLGIKVGSDPEMTPRQQLTMAPYAYRAVMADSVMVSGVDAWALAAGAVTAAALANGAVTSGKLAAPISLSYSSTTTPTITGNNDNNIGVAGYSSKSVGIKGSSNIDTGVWGIGNIGVDGLSDGGTGVVGRSTSGTGVLATSAASGQPGLLAKNTGGGDILRGSNGSSQVLTLTNGGNISTAGQIESKSGGIKFPDGTIQTTASRPTWSQILPAADRFVLVMGDAAVLDKETGLVWQRDTDSKLRNWVDALDYCYNLNLGGRMGWRPPSAEELSSLVDPAYTNPALPPGHPFRNVYSEFYWSSTTYAGDTVLAWSVYFNYYQVSTVGKESNYYVRCVRGGQ